jgi:hypothetical protein
VAEDEQQPDAQAANPNVMHVNELKTLFSNPKADIPIFTGTKPRIQCSIASKLLKQLTTGQIWLQQVISNLPLEERQLTG